MPRRPPRSFDKRRLLRQLLSRSWSSYNRLARYGFVVHPAIPILFFGNSARYFESRCRIITVGLNPSSEEFPTGDRFSRFPIIGNIAYRARRDGRRHLAAL